MKLSNDQRALFQRDGVIPLGRLLNESEVASLRGHWSRLVENNLAVDTLFGTGHPMFRLQDPVRNDPWFWHIIGHPAVLDAAESVLGPNIQYFEDQIFHKPAHEGGRTVWHQDNYWARADPPDVVTIWIAVNDATAENGALQYVSGSHHGLIAGIEIHYEELTGNRALVIADSQIDVSQLKCWDVPAGHAIMHHCQTIHGASPNTSPVDRVGYAVHLQRTGVLKKSTIDFPILRGRIPVSGIPSAGVTADLSV